MNTEELKKYLKPSAVSEIVIGSILAVFGLICLVSVPIGGIIFLALAALFLWMGISKQNKFNKTFDGYVSSGQINYILADFSSSLPLVNFNIRMGQNYVYGKGSGQIVPYHDIRKIYQHVHRTNFVEDRRELHYVNSQGKVNTLCALQLRNKSQDDLVRIVAIVQAKNPTVHIGYK